MRNDQGPRSDLSDKLHAFKYRQPRETFREAMNRIAAALKAWKAGAKGLSTFNADGKRAGVRKATAPDTADLTCTIDDATGRRECA